MPNFKVRGPDIKNVTIVAVFHGAKVEGLDQSLPEEIRANPPMTPKGMANILALVDKVGKWGPFDAFFCSRLARASDAVSVLSLKFDLDFQSMAELGQHANKDGDTVIAYPGHEGEGLENWKADALRAVRKIHDSSKDGACVLVTSHRPIIGGLVAAAWERDDLKTVVHDPELTKDGFVVFETYEIPGNEVGVTQLGTVPLHMQELADEGW